uniref:Transmembrane protein 180 n=1 Tax=Oncorhynchus tshawytscha TaxID=74940 RepID=A0AAZ3RH75_ONCTS
MKPPPGMTVEKPAAGVRTFGGLNILGHLASLGAHPAAVAYSMTTLGAGMMNSIFSFYYVKLFLNKYKISEGAFHQSQVVYMVWNAVNDPLFGYLQDNSRVPCCSQRRLSILYGAPFYAIAFLLAWFPWREYARRLDERRPPDGGVVCCFFTCFILACIWYLFCCLKSVKCSHVCLLFPPSPQVASLIGSSSVLFCGLLSQNMDDFPSFQGFTVLVAVLACGCMFYTGLHSESRFDTKGSAPRSNYQGSGQSTLSFSLVISMTLQILTNRDFQLFVLMNFFQVFMVAFCNNFTMIFAEHLIPPNVLPSLAKSFMYGAGFICPQLVVLSSQSLLHSLGYYKIILLTFYVEAGMAAVMLVLGPHHYYILAFFLTANMVLVQAAFSLFNLPLADIIDSDLQRHKRSSPLSSMVFGTNALFTKPAQSLAPMLVVSILNQFGYENLKDAGRDANPSDLEALHTTMFYLVCVVPMCIAALQVFAWKPFSIRNSHTVDTMYIDG